MLSLLENVNTPPRSTTVHILHDNTLTLDNRDKFSYLAGRYGQLVKFYNVEELCADKLAEIKKFMPGIVNTQFSIASLYRLFIPQIFSREIEKCIYLDSDIIVHLDINEFWRIELGDKVLGVIPELSNGHDAKKHFDLCRDNIVKAEDYFNSGVLLMNLKILREKEDLITNGLKFIGERNGYWDQDTLNYCFATKALKLPTKFNRFVLYARTNAGETVGRKIYHYTAKPQADMNDPYNRLWMNYFVKTPWFNEETIGNLYAGVQGLHVGLKNFALQVSTIMSGKTRAFFVLPPNVDALKKIFSVHDDEEIILAENQESLQKLIDAMKLSAGKKVFFILVPGFTLQILIQAGFVYGRDFLNGFDFLSEAHGVPFDSYQLIKAM